MLTRRPAECGVSLVELVIALSIGAFLILAGAPNFREWIQNTQIRNAAESIQNGLAAARAEAVRRNSAVRFQLTTTLTNTCELSAAGANWVVSLADPAGKCATPASDTVEPRIIQVSSSTESYANASVAAGQSVFTFNGWGMLTTPAASINVSNPTGGACVTSSGKMRCLRITVSSTGQVRMCDPARSSSDPEGC